MTVEEKVMVAAVVATVVAVAVAVVQQYYISTKNTRKKSRVVVCTSGKGLEMVKLEHASGAVAEVYVFGATVTRYCTAEKVEVLWVSELAKYDGKKAIRGGIPLVFPQFGPKADALVGEAEPMAQHGFARTSMWEVIGPSTEVRMDGDCQATFRLTDSAETRKKWPFKFELEYVVRLNGSALRTELKMRNLDTVPMTPQALLHTYYRTDASSEARVAGFEKASKFDSLTGEVSTEGPLVALQGEVDCIYAPVQGSLALTHVGSDAKVDVQAYASYVREFGEACAAPEPFVPDVVLWNPHVAKAKAMSDFPDDGWKNMLCIEPGVLNLKRPKIEPGNAVLLGQRICT